MSNLLKNGYFTSPVIASGVSQSTTPTFWTLAGSLNNYLSWGNIVNPYNPATPPVGSNITQIMILQHYNTPAITGVYQDIVFPYTGYGTISFYTEKRIGNPTAGLTITIQMGTSIGSYNYADTVWHYDSFNFAVTNNLTLRLTISSATTSTGTYDQTVFISGINITFFPFPIYPKIFDNSANAMTANYRNGLIFNSQLVVNNNSSFNSQQNNHSLDFISDQYYGEGYQNMTVAFSSTQNRIPIYRSITLPTFQKSTNFSASYLNGCFIWLDAADYYTYSLTSTSVNSWLDKSSSSVSLVQTGAAGLKPIYTANSLNGKSTLAFTRASLQYLIKPSTQAIGTNSFAMFVVCKFNTITDNNMHIVFGKNIYASGAGRFTLFKQTTNKIIAFMEHGGSTYPDATGFTITSTGYNIYALICNRVAGVDTVYYNGTSKVTASYVSDIATNLTNTYDILVGVCNSTNGTDVLPTTTANTYLDGGVAEIICFRTPTDMTDATRQKIEGYLAWKWELISNLPSGHPWLYDQPTFGLQS